MARVAGVKELASARGMSSPTVSQDVSRRDKWSSALLPAITLVSASLFLPAAAKLSVLPVRFMSAPFCRRDKAGLTGVAVPGVADADTVGAIGASSAIE